GPREELDLGERRDRPARDRDQERRAEPSLGRRAQRGLTFFVGERRGGGEERGHDQTDRRRDDEALVRLREEDLRGRQRVEGQEPRAGKHGKRDQEQAGVVP